MATTETVRFDLHISAPLAQDNPAAASPGSDWRINIEVTTLGDDTLCFPDWKPKVSVAEPELL